LLDLYVSNITDWIFTIENKLFINNGTTFDDQTNIYNASNFGYNKSLCWGDYDNDGDQDLFLCVGHVSGVSESKLYRNDGNIFTDVTSVYNISTNTQNRMNSTWIDFDNDNDLDLYIYLSAIENRLYENKVDENDTFIEVAAVYSLNDSGSAGGSLWFDFDNDDDHDLFIINSISTSFPHLYPPSKLYRNDLNINGQFTDVTTLVGFPNNLSSYKGSFGDYDLDGDLDLYLTDHHKINKYFRNDFNNTGIFIEEGSALNIVDTLEGNAAVSGDYDNDGDLDIFVLNGGGTEFNSMYRNEINSYNYLFIRLTDLNGSYNRFGSKVKVFFAGSDSLVGMRVVDGGGTGGSSQNQYDCHFGLDENLAHDIEVIFTTRSNGQNHIFNKHNRSDLGNYIPAQHGHFLEVRDSIVTVTPINPSQNPNLITTFKLYQNYPNPFNATTVIPFQLEKSYNVKIIIYDVSGKEIALVKKQIISKGYHKVTWDSRNNTGDNVASGVYMCSLFLDNKLQDVRKLILLR